MPTDTYVFVTSPAVGDDLDAGRLRGYALADAHARYRRACGDEVLFTLALDAFASTPPEGEDASAWAEARSAALRDQLEAVAASLDWDRSVSTDSPELVAGAQWLFVAALEAGLAERRGTDWYLRTGALNEESHARLDDLDGWSEAARAAQRELLHRVEGVEVEGRTLDGAPLTLFTPHGGAIASAEFVALSPQRPELDDLIGDDRLQREVAAQRERDWSGVKPAQRPAIELGVSAQVPGVARPLPVLVSAAVDARYGPAAILGIPDADEGDEAIARELAKSGGLAWKTDAKPPKTTPAVRFRAPDMPLSQASAWGAPVPVVHCDACGAVPLPMEMLPLGRPGGVDPAECPRCGAQARGDAGTVHPRVGAALAVVALAVPPPDRSTVPPDHQELQRWLPTARTVADAAAAAALLDARTIAKVLRDLGPLGFLADGEPHGPTTAHAPLRFDGDVTVAALVERFGADAVRFAVLNAAAPGKEVAVGEPALRSAAAFLERLQAFAGPRLAELAPDARIDAGDGLRRRLASWCDTAVERIGENYERLDLHRATRNAVTLLDRIEDFDRRVVEYRGELAGADRDAAAIALGALVRLLAPVAPGVAGELWAQLAGGQPLTGAPWPQRQREAATAA